MTLPSFDGPTVVASQSFSSSFAPEVVALAGGGFAVVWRGSLPSIADADQGPTILARLFDADRQPLGDAFAVPENVAGSQSDFLVSGTADGGFAVAFVNTEIIGETPVGTRVVRFDSDGNRVGTELTVADIALVGLAGFSNGQLALLNSDSSAGFELTVFTAAHDATALDAQVVADGASSVGAPNNLERSGAQRVAFVEFGSGEIVNNQRTVNATLHRLEPDGTSIETVLLDAAPGDGIIAGTLPDGRAVAVITNPLFNDFSVQSLTIKIFNSNGAELSSAVSPFISGPPSNFQIVPEPEGGFFIVFTAGQVFSSPFLDVSAIKVNSDGTIEGEPFPLARDDGGFQGRASGDALNNGDIVFAFESSTSAFANSEILIQAFDPEGDTAGAPPTDIVLDSPGNLPRDVKGQVIGELSAVDADAGDTFLFEVDANLIDPRFFEINGTTLSFGSNVSADDLGGVSSVPVKVTDSFFNTFFETLQFTLEGTGGGGGTPVVPIVFRGSGAADKRNGKATDDVLLGRGGKDVLNGKGGADRIEGGKGADRLNGGNGNDVIEGGKGRDVLVGGKGRDQFLYGPKDGFDVIKDFEVNRDHLVFTGGPKRFKDCLLYTSPSPRD